MICAWDPSDGGGNGGGDDGGSDDDDGSDVVEDGLSVLSIIAVLMGSLMPLLLLFGTEDGTGGGALSTGGGAGSTEGSSSRPIHTT